MSDLTPFGQGADDPDSGLGFDMLAASIRADASDVGSFLNVLGRKLAGALPEQVELEHERKRFRETDAVSRVVVTLEDLRFELEKANGRFVAMISHVVRGMRLKSDEVGVDEWIDRLSQQLAKAAEKSSRARAAIEGML